MKNNMPAARIYLRVSTDDQSLERQKSLIDDVKSRGFYIAGVYAEKKQGVVAERPELTRLIDDLQPGDWVFAESIDRITRLPPREAEKLIGRITEKGARIQVPEIFDMREFEALLGSSDDLRGYLFEPLLDAMQKMFLRIALDSAHGAWQKLKKRQKEGVEIAKRKGVYRGRKPNLKVHQSIIAMRAAGTSIAKTAAALNVSASTVNRICREYNEKKQKEMPGQTDFLKEKSPIKK